MILPQLANATRIPLRVTDSPAPGQVPEAQAAPDAGKGASFHAQPRTVNPQNPGRPAGLRM